MLINHIEFMDTSMVQMLLNLIEFMDTCTIFFQVEILIITVTIK